MYTLGQTSEKLVSYYDILHVRPDSSDRDIKQAYHSMAKRFHPDRVTLSDNRDRRMAELRFRLINEAYSHLKTRQQRDHYNRILNSRMKTLHKAQNDNRPKGFLGMIAHMFWPASPAKGTESQ